MSDNSHPVHSKLSSSSLNAIDKTSVAYFIASIDLSIKLANDYTTAYNQWNVSGRHLRGRKIKKLYDARMLAESLYISMQTSAKKCDFFGESIPSNAMTSVLKGFNKKLRTIDGKVGIPFIFPSAFPRKYARRLAALLNKAMEQSER